MAILDPRIPEKIARRGAFDRGLGQENLLKIGPLVSKLKVQFFIIFLGPTPYQMRLAESFSLVSWNPKSPLRALGKLIFFFLAKLRYVPD